MKSTLVILGVFCALLAPLLAFDPARRQFEEECMKGTSVTIDDLHAMKQKNVDEISNDVFCVIKCVDEKMGNIDASGKLVPDKFKQSPIYQRLTQDQQDKFLKCLGGLSAIKECKDMANIMKCFRENVPLLPKP